MLKFENECVGCPQGCINCGRKHVAVWVCDECGCEADELWEYEEQQLCQDCLLEAVPKAEMKADEPDDEYDMADYEYEKWKDEE